MAALDTFPNLPLQGEIPVCERDGRICSLPINEVDSSNLCKQLSYPEINIGRELFHHAAGHVQDHRRTIMVPINETLIKRITRTFFEEGPVEALNEAANSNSQHYNVFLGSLARYMLVLVDVGNSIKFFLKPHLKEQGVGSVGKYTQTRDWSKSAIRCIRWHPNCFKIAIAASDDSIRVYGDEPSIVPILKSGLQKSITSLAWRPFTAGELAVGCQNGALIWNIDPNSLITRPLSQAVRLRHGNHFPVTSVEWSPNGCLLASASINDPAILIWDVDQNKQVPLRRVGPPCALLKWSPTGSRLCATTVSNVFRVWKTDRWTPDRWTINSGTIQSVVWSHSGSHLLFVTTEESLLYCLGFIEDEVFTSTFAPKSALPIADLSKITIGKVEVGGRPQALAWCPRSRYLAVTFKDTPAIAIFNTVNVAHSRLNITPLCFLTGIGIESASCISFQENLGHRSNEKLQTVLTIGWSSGRIQYFPFV
ncbi:aladin-like [Toxorhynchites rutilus septentrionalis]|uniref:aladin-like n=1 Tax=Toxorhynchites rutilus septentrionalis TaxID=329112 RepID=UPI002478E611|nr:aladin-like [Toxorhynchites rutilus septentrionalis]